MVFFFPNETTVFVITNYDEGKLRLSINVMYVKKVDRLDVEIGLHCVFIELFTADNKQVLTVWMQDSLNNTYHCY